MFSVNQIIGGSFQDSDGNPLANGYLLFELNQDGIVNVSTRVCAGRTIQVPLNALGSVGASPVYSLWPNDVLSPAMPPSPESPVTAQLGLAAAYAVLAHSGITNTGGTLITGGNVGSFPTTSITGLTGTNFVPPATIDNTNASAAKTSLTAALVYYESLTPTLSGLSNLSVEGNGSTPATYTAGVYIGSSTLTIPTGIILDAQGDKTAQFIFLAGSTINLASGQSVTLLNGALAENVVFVAGTSFIASSASTMNGNILALTNIILDGGILTGRALASNGSVTIAAATAITVPASIPASNSLASFYTVSAYSASGQLVWGPNPQSVLYTPSPFDIGAWVPGNVT